MINTHNDGSPPNYYVKFSDAIKNIIEVKYPELKYKVTCTHIRNPDYSSSKGYIDAIYIYR